MRLLWSLKKKTLSLILNPLSICYHCSLGETVEILRYIQRFLFYIRIFITKLNTMVNVKGEQIFLAYIENGNSQSSLRDSFSSKSLNRRRIDKDTLHKSSQQFQHFLRNASLILSVVNPLLRCCLERDSALRNECS